MRFSKDFLQKRTQFLSLPYWGAAVIVLSIAVTSTIYLNRHFKSGSSSSSSELKRQPANAGTVLDPSTLAPATVTALNRLNAAVTANFRTEVSLQNGHPSNAQVTPLNMFNRRLTAFEQLVNTDPTVRQLWTNLETSLRSELPNLGLIAVEISPRGISVQRAPNASSTNLFSNAVNDLLDSTPNGLTRALLQVEPVCDGVCGFASGPREANFNMDEIILSRDLSLTRGTGLVLHERSHVVDAYLESRGEHTTGVSVIVRPHNGPPGYTDGFVLGELRAFSDEQRVSFANLSRQSPAYETMREQSNFQTLMRLSAATMEMTQAVRSALANNLISTRDISGNDSGPGIQATITYRNAGGTESSVTIKLPHVARGESMAGIVGQIRDVWLPDVEATVLKVLNQARQGSERLVTAGVLNANNLNSRRQDLERVVSDSRGRLTDTGPVVVSRDASVNRLAEEMYRITPFRADTPPSDVPAFHVDTSPIPPQSLGQHLARDIAANFSTRTATGLTAADVFISSLDAISAHGPAFTEAARTNNVAAMNAIIQQVNRDKNLSAAATVLFVPAVRAGALGTISVAIRMRTSVGALSAADAARMARLAPRMANAVTAGVVLILSVPAMYEFFTDANVRQQFYEQVRWMKNNPRVTLRIALEAVQADFRAGCAQIPQCATFVATALLANHYAGNLFRNSVTQQPSYGNNAGSSVMGPGGQTTFYVSPNPQGSQVPIPSPNWRWQIQQASNAEGSVVSFNRSLVDSHTNLPPDLYQSVLNAGQMPAYLAEYNRRLELSLASPDYPHFNSRDVLAAIGYSQPVVSNFMDRSSSAVGPGFSILETPSAVGGTNLWPSFSVSTPYLYSVDPSFSYGDMASFVRTLPQLYFSSNLGPSGDLFGSGLGTGFGNSSTSSGSSSGSGAINGLTDSVSPLGASPEQTAFILPSYSPQLSDRVRNIVGTAIITGPKLYTRDGEVATPAILNQNNPPPVYTERELFFEQQQTRMALEALSQRQPVVDPEKQRWARDRENLSYLVRYRPALQLISPALPGPIAGTGNGYQGSSPPPGGGSYGGQNQPDPSVSVSPFEPVKPVEPVEPVEPVKCKLGDQEIPSGGSIRAYRSRVLFDPCGLCDEEMEIRVCQPSGELTGSARYLSCSAATNFGVIRKMCL